MNSELLSFLLAFIFCRNITAACCSRVLNESVYKDSTKKKARSRWVVYVNKTIRFQAFSVELGCSCTIMTRRNPSYWAASKLARLGFLVCHTGPRRPKSKSSLLWEPSISPICNLYSFCSENIMVVQLINKFPTVNEIRDLMTIQ